MFRGAESGGVLQDSISEHFSFENENDLVMVACLGNADPVDKRVCCPEGNETFNDEVTMEEAPSRGDCREAARR